MKQSEGRNGRKGEVKVVSRREFLTTVTIAAGVVLTGCGAAGGAVGGGASGGAAGTAAAGGGSNTSGGSSGDKITINQWYHQYGEEGTQQAAIRYAQEYTKANPNVEVKVTWVPGDYDAKRNAAMLTPEGPDVFEGGPTLDMVKAGQIAPLDDLFTADVKKDWNPLDLQAATINGKIYAVKMLVDTGLLYYRKSMIDKAGVQVPKTMDELIAAAKKLSSGKVKGLFVGNDGGITSLVEIAPWSAGSVFTQDNKIAFDNERTAAAWKKVKELNDSGALLIGAPTDWWDPSAFTQGLVAMQWTGLWAMPGIKKAIGDDFVVSAWPALDAQGTPATFRGGWASMVNAKSKNIEEAKKFVKWLWIENTKDQQDWNLSYGFHVPPRISAASAAAPLKSGAPAQAVEILNKYGKSDPPIWTGPMGSAIGDALTKIVKNGADPTAEMKTAAQKCNDELKRIMG